MIFVFQWTPNLPSQYTNCTLNLGNYPWHFCLLSRIVDTNLPDDGMTVAEGINVDVNVRNNNNIAWRNLAVVNLIPSANNRLIGQGSILRAGNIFSRDETFNLEFRLPDNYTHRPTTEQAEIKITLDEKTWSKWIEGGRQSENIQTVNGEKAREMNVTGHRTKLKNITYSLD